MLLGLADISTKSFKDKHKRQKLLYHQAKKEIVIPASNQKGHILLMQLKTKQNYPFVQLGVTRHTLAVIPEFASRMSGI